MTTPDKSFHFVPIYPREINNLENSQKIWSKSHAEALATELRIKVCSRSQRYQIEPSKYKSMGSTVTIYDDGGF